MRLIPAAGYAHVMPLRFLMFQDSVLNYKNQHNHLKNIRNNSRWLFYHDYMFVTNFSMNNRNNVNNRNNGDIVNYINICGYADIVVN